jgi:hypothetical protein
MQPPAQTQQVPAQSGAATPKPARPPAPKVPPEFDALPIWKMDAPKLVAMVKGPEFHGVSEGDSVQETFHRRGQGSCPADGCPAERPASGLLREIRHGTESRPIGGRSLPCCAPQAERQASGGVIHSIGFRKDPKAVSALGN